MNIYGIRSGSEDSSLNILYLCAPFFVGDIVNNDEYYMNMALKEAKRAFDKGEIPIGAVVVQNGKIIARGHNMKESKFNVTRHAEIIVIEKACRKLKNWRLIDCVVYVTLFPCPMCASAINQARISKIVYGTMPEYADKLLIDNILKDRRYGLPVDIYGNVLESDCRKLLKDFFVEKR